MISPSIRDHMVAIPAVFPGCNIRDRIVGFPVAGCSSCSFARLRARGLAVRPRSAPDFFAQVVDPLYIDDFAGVADRLELR